MYPSCKGEGSQELPPARKAATGPKTRRLTLYRPAAETGSAQYRYVWLRRGYIPGGSSTESIT
jgi:hypothetical protein